MSQTPPGGADEGPVVLVQITPRSYRVRSVAALVAGAVWTLVAVVLEAQDAGSGPNPFLGVAVIGYGIWCAVQARHQVTRTLLRVDREGFRSDEGAYDRGWAGVVMVWVGSSTGLRLPVVVSPTVSVFTGGGVDFARRAGTAPKPLHTLPVGGTWTVDRLCAQLREITDVPVVDGTKTSRRRAAAALAAPHVP
ncbi:hypothetical protein GCM10022197_13820 [Microlunatus spumicola]|uniref:PH domain-containing protein n=1 Tax=Microlunatus spumicola TaxID=81499 RepID=A0ABP6X352_9ACTN